MKTLMAGLWIGCGVWGAACLDGDRRAAVDATAADTSADTTTDVGSDVGGCGDCDDKDPCTFDRCNADGVCEHLMPPAAEPGAMPAPECTGNGDCDDNDPCTDDVCIGDTSGCGTIIAQCVHAAVPGCTHPCQYQEECDDGNACTIDTCLGDGTCQNLAQEGCDPRCTSAGLVPVAELQTMGTSASEVRTVGLVLPWRAYLACNDGPTCDCQGAPAVTEGGYELGLRAGVGGGGVPALPPLEPWSCETHGCIEPATVACRPVAEGVSYRIWGQPVALWSNSTSGAAVAPMQGIEGIAVEGYCLDTAPASLSGHYAGELEVMPGMVIAFDVDMLAVDQGVLVTMSAAKCLSGGCPEWALKVPQQDSILEEGDGQVGLLFTAPAVTGLQSAHAQLFARESQLTGTWAPARGLPLGVAILEGGRMTLTRIGLGRLPPLVAL